MLLVSGLMIASFFIASSVTLTQEPVQTGYTEEETTIRIHVMADGNMKFENDKIPVAEFAGQLKELKKKKAHLAFVHFTIDPETPMGIYEDVTDALQELAILHVNYNTTGLKDFKMVLPRKGDADPIAQISDKNKYIIQITKEGRILLDGFPKNQDDLRPYIQIRLKTNPNLIVNVNSDPATPAGYQLSVLDEVKESSAMRIATDL